MKEQFCIFKASLFQRFKAHDKWAPVLSLVFSLKYIREYFGVYFSLRKDDITVMAQVSVGHYFPVSASNKASV